MIEEEWKVPRVSTVLVWGWRWLFFHHSLTFALLPSTAGGKSHHPPPEWNLPACVKHTSCRSFFYFFLFPPPPSLHMRSFLRSSFSRLLCAVSGLPSGGDWQPSSSCFVPFPLCPPSISPSVAGIYAALLQSLRRTSWLLPGEANWLLSHSRALLASGLTSAVAKWDCAHTGMVWSAAAYRWPLRVDSLVIGQLCAFLLDFVCMCVYVF